jgi:hypothetical protein
MSKESIWKRMGGWFRRSQQSDSPEDVIHHDAEGILVAPDLGKNERTIGSLLTPRKAKEQLRASAMEQGFSQLIGVLESLNDNVVNQQQYIARVQENLKDLPEFNRTQIEHLSQMVKHMESSISTESKMAGSLTQIDSSMHAMSQNSEKLTTALHTLNDVLRQNEQQIQRLIRNQNRRFTWLLVMLGLFVLTAIILIISILSASGGNKTI